MPAVPLRTMHVVVMIQHIIIGKYIKRERSDITGTYYADTRMFEYI